MRCFSIAVCIPHKNVYAQWTQCTHTAHCSAIILSSTCSNNNKMVSTTERERHRHRIEMTRAWQKQSKTKKKPDANTLNYNDRGVCVCAVMPSYASEQNTCTFRFLCSLHPSVIQCDGEWTGKCQQGYRKNTQHTIPYACVFVPFAVINFQKLPRAHTHTHTPYMRIIASSLSLSV